MILIIEPPEKIVELFKECNKSKDFIDLYIKNAILSLIEEKEQDLILSMRYNEWVHIDKDELIARIIDYINIFSKACMGYGLDDSTREALKISLEDNIDSIVCSLYRDGIFNDNISRYIIIKDIEDSACTEKLKNMKEFYVRSRFIEIARNLYFVKQRFRDKTVYESIPLVDRVLAYAEPRLIPLGKISPKAFYDDIWELVKKLYHTYNVRILKREPDDEEYKILGDILKEFFNTTFDFSFYVFQLRGVKKILQNMVKAIGSGEAAYNVIEAPTGAGKTEIFILSLLILALVRRLSLYHLFSHGGYIGEYKTIHECSTPVGLIIYPRRALASNQLNRLLRYLWSLNNVLKKHIPEDTPFITLSMNYTEVRPENEYLGAIKRGPNGRGKVYVHKKYKIRVFVFEEKGYRFLELRHFKCPNGDYPRLIAYRENGEWKLNTDMIYCGDEEISYIRVIKDKVKESPGDIHVTLFETLRYNLLSSSWRKIFGIPGFDGPLLIVLDEIHTYVNITGARYAYLLRRLLTRIKYNICKSSRCSRGYVVVGVSATIPNPKEFLEDLFMTKFKDIDEIMIRIRSEETVPMGNEYFFIIVPTMKYTVQYLSVTIQNVMTLFYNMPAYKIGDEYRKKAFIFIDNLDVIARALKDLADAIWRKGYGLQDLRNPSHKIFENTVRDYGEHWFKWDLWHIDKYRSWLDGELWWPYALEVSSGKASLGICINGSCTTRLKRVIQYTSRRKTPITQGDLILTTSALEVGVDYSDVVLIYQHGMPLNIAALVQRAGRAGRRVVENPLIRVAIGVLLSPEIPSQATLFEIFTRSHSLREALKYDRLYVPTRNEYIIRQTMVESILDFMTYNGRTYISDIDMFECKVIPEFIRKHRNKLLDYLSEIFPFLTPVDIDGKLDEILGELLNLCHEMYGGGYA